MGLEIVKDQKGKNIMVYDSDNYFNDKNMGDKLEDFQTLQILHEGSIDLLFKVRSVINSKIYAMREIDLQKMTEDEVKKCESEIENLKKMNNRYILKHHKYFKQKGKLYVIIEFVDNGNLLKIRKSYESNKEQFPEDKIWSIFFQCAECLNYLHSINIIHSNIKAKNIYFTEDQTIKLGGFGISPIVSKDNKEIIENYLKKQENTYEKVGESEIFMSPEIANEDKYGPQADIFSMGVSLYNLCYFSFPYNLTLDDNRKQFEKDNSKKNNFEYSKELNDILERMIVLQPDKRINAEELYKSVKEEYIKRCVQNTSIEAVIRCLYSYKNITDKYLNDYSVNINGNGNNNPISLAYLNCLQNIKNNKELNLYLYEIREKCLENKNIGNETEIDNNLVLSFLLDKLHQEYSISNRQKDIPTFGMQFENNEDAIKENCIKKYYEYKNKYYKSIISRFFTADIKTKRVCDKEECRQGTYLMEMLPFIKFNLNICFNEKNIQKYNQKEIEKWFNTQNNNYVVLSKSQCIFCKHCKINQVHNEFKQFLQLPQNLIISIFRGDNCENKNSFNYGKTMSLFGYDEAKNNYTKNYKLIGIIKRYDEIDKEYYLSLYLDSFTNSWKEFDKNVIKDCDDPMLHTKGDVIMLFYYGE